MLFITTMARHEKAVTGILYIVLWALSISTPSLLAWLRRPPGRHKCDGGITAATYELVAAHHLAVSSCPADGGAPRRRAGHVCANSP